MSSTHPGTHHHHIVHPHAEPHRSNRAGWLRAAVLGANDGVVSTACLIVGIAGAGASFAAVRTAGIAGLAAGALSMAVGEYVSVASQRDIEQADLRIESQALQDHPVAELRELAQIWEQRGLERDLAMKVAEQLTADDALGGARVDELGLTADTRAQPVQAATTSALAFTLGAFVPLLAFLVAPDAGRSAVVIGAAVLALVALGAIGAVLGAASRLRAMARVGIGGAARDGGHRPHRRADRRCTGVAEGWQDGAMTIAEPAPAVTDTATRTAYRTCPLCEASCGLEITLAPDARPARRSCGSAATGTTCSATGYICPKGSTLKQLHEDPDRLRRAAGASATATFVEVDLGRGLRRGRAPAAADPRASTGATRVRRVRRATPTPTTSPALLYDRPLLRALGTTNVFSASHGRPAAEGDLRRP